MYVIVARCRSRVKRVMFVSHVIAVSSAFQAVITVIPVRIVIMGVIVVMAVMLVVMCPVTPAIFV